MKLIPTPAFVRAAKKLIRTNSALDQDLELALNLLRLDVFHPKLGTHKLKGGQSSNWSCKVAYDARIIFRFVDEGGEKAILLLTIGSHDDVY
jgi:mRNA-degrading endonuclease YafQ of YafQ-DinJ toxin-antitoxin module